MYKSNQPYHSTENLLAWAIAANNAENLKWEDQPQPFQSDVGDYPRIGWVHYAEGTQPAMLVYRRGAHAIAAFSGIQGIREGNLCYEGYLNPVTIPGHVGSVNAYAKAWYDAIWDRWSVFNAPTVHHWTFIGHSWGSSTATLLANWMKQFRPNCRVDIITYGAPRWAYRDFFLNLHCDGAARVHNHADPIPYLIPHFTEAPLFHATHLPQNIMRMNSYVHMGGGIYVRQNEAPVWREEPGGLSYPLELRPMQIREIFAVGAHHHLMETYVARLRNYIEGIPVPQPSPQGQQSQPASNTPPRMTLDDANAMAQWPQVAWPVTQQPNGSVPVPPPTPAAPPPLTPEQEAAVRIRIRRVTGVWYVFVGDQIVYRGVSKRDAKGFAKAMRQMQGEVIEHPEGVINPDTLVSTVSGRNLGGGFFFDP